MNYHNAAQPQPKKFNHKERKVLHKDHSAAQPQPNFLYESGEIASEKASQWQRPCTLMAHGTLSLRVKRSNLSLIKNGTSWKRFVKKLTKKRSFYGVIL